MNRRFFYSLFRRKNAKGEKIYFVRFFDEETRELVATFSTKTASRRNALQWADGKLLDEIGLEPSFSSRLIDAMKKTKDQKPARYALDICLEELKNQVRDNPEEKAAIVHLLGDTLASIDNEKGVVFADFLVDFWDWEKSGYIKRRLAEGHRMGQGHAANCKRYAETHARRFFGDSFIISLTTDDLERYKIFLTQQRCQVSGNKKEKTDPENMPFLDPSSVNKIFRSALVAVNDAYRRGLIKSNPALNISMLAETEKKKGILYLKEARNILRKKYWTDERYRVASILAASTGMRLGEICALTVDKLKPGSIEVSASYDKKYNVIKSTKSGKVRHVPLDDALRNKLLALVKKNPWGNSYVFYGNTKESPLAGSAVAGGFLRALALYGMTPEERKERRISFHSWRSFANSELGKTLDPAKLRAVIGHTSERLTDMYTSITTEDSGKIIDFQERFLRGVR